MSEVNCPYCDNEVTICRDDGDGLEEDVRHEQMCEHCEKNFVFTTQISVSHQAYAADCLNGSPHNWTKSVTYPIEFTRWMCSDCDAEKALTKNDTPSVVSESVEPKIRHENMSPDDINKRHGEIIYRCRPCQAAIGLSWFANTSCPVCARPECHAALGAEYQAAYDSLCNEEN